MEEDGIDPVSMGRSASKVESIEEAISELEARAKTFVSDSSNGYLPHRSEISAAGRDDDAGTVVGFSSLTSFSTFKEIEPDRLAFVGTPCFDPKPFLDRRGREVFERPLKFSLPPEGFVGTIPHVKMHCSREAKIRLFELLDKGGRLSLHYESEIRPSFASGMFSVVKSLDRDRLILDSRPANLLEVPLQRWIRSLATGESLSQICLDDDEILLSSGNDVRDYYHRFAVSTERCRRNVLAGHILPSEVSHLSCFRSEFEKAERLWGSLATLAMGDTQAVELAQTCHLGIALQAKLATENNILNLAGFFPRGKMFMGIIIDDFISMSVVHRSDPLPSPGADIASRMEDRYGEVGLIAHKGKGFRDSLNASFWGVDIDGDVGLLRGSLKRAIPLFGLVLRIARLGYITAGLLQVICGSVVSLFLFRRRLLSVLDLVFQACRGRADGDIVQLSGKMKSELLTLALLLPVAVSNLRAKIQERIVATDASSWGEAAVVAKAPFKVCKELHRYSLRKPVWTKLLPPGKAWERAHGFLGTENELPGENDCYATNPFWETAAECLNYELLFKRASPAPRHINIGEVRSFLFAERILGKEKMSTRDIFGLDSQVSLGCLIKGRSVSKGLNRELKKSIGNHILFDCYPAFMYFEPSKNPSDDPTRDAPLRRRRYPPPLWWNSLAEGDADPFDVWASSHKLSFAEVTGLPPFEELLGDSGREFEDDSTLFRSPHREEEVPVFAQGSTPAFDDSKEKFFTADSCEEVVTKVPASGASLGSAAEDPAPRECSLGLGKVANRERSSEDFQFEPTFESTEGLVRGEVAAEILELLGSFPRTQVVMSSEEEWPPKRAGFLDLFSGEKGVASEIFRQSGFWVLTFDIIYGANQDLGDRKLRRKLERLLELQCFHGCGSAPVCRSFSVAVTPAIRTKAHPYGLEDVSEKVKKSIQDGNDTAVWLLKLLLICLKSNTRFWLENPSLSWLFRLPIFLEFLDKHKGQLGFWIADYCRYGKRWRKRTKFLTDTCIKDIKTLCLGCKSHVKLRGRSAFHRKSWTLVAQPYPRGVCSVLAKALLISSGLSSGSQSFDPASCARCTNARIGEAANPGPVADREGLLEDVPLVEAKTAALQSKVWKKFESWLRARLSPGAFDATLASPLLLCRLLKEYGNVLYSEGAALYIYRHLCVFVQKSVIGAKPFMNIVWDNLHRWESLEPVVHRVPIPGSLLRAMVSLALAWKWPRFAATICISFFGITRPGEVLRASRRDLVLPRDVLLENENPAYLRILDPKARRRGKQRVQHASIYNLEVVRFLDAVFGSLNKGELLYPISGGSFRRRWDKICLHLFVPRALKLTPGPLRGGGALEEYRSGADLQRILWRMRIRHLITLEHYVQEVAGESFLADVSSEGRRRISLLAKLFGPSISSF